MEELSILDEVRVLLVNYDVFLDRYTSTLQSLSSIVVKSSTVKNYRIMLANNKELWNAIAKCSRTANRGTLESIKDRNFYLRTVKGVVLLARNLSVENQILPQEFSLQDNVVDFLSSFQPLYDEMEVALYQVGYEFLYNISRNCITFNQATLDALCQVLSYPSRLECNEALTLPWSLYFSRIIRNEEFAYCFLKHPSCDQILFDYMIEDIIKNNTNLFDAIGTKSHSLEELSTLGSIQADIWVCIVSNESFTKYLKKVESQNWDIFHNILLLSQLIVTSSEKWDKYQLTSIMAWAYGIFESAAKNVELYFEDDLDDDLLAHRLHQNMTISLDIISALSKFEHVRKFILFYGGLEVLIKTLGTLQKNCIKINFHKDTAGVVSNVITTNDMGEKIENTKKINKRIDYASGSIKPTNFPECKSLIIEILGFLAYKNREVQDKCRELHGMELVLSNCLIDDNDPFIKERSIICIRLLLEENQENQWFVAQLEAKKAVDNEVLSQAGYEVKIDHSGQIQLASKPTGDIDDTNVIMS
ncbi:Ctr86p Ecym_2094 [Eremothecium cymbalariae DBVPG|uniref:Ataxin-10 homolog n=1 Tax=Eremothecium cymbalariae (strain CBS 270.75 / DBVPG 7215 / KCTC 17166 / NRRL Y-17582) TaxID=931890 RepID=G8JPJ8_ERECY|nr:Hypothetical protein Ecym_2094 [Eremothecium cymbalariae DBVPG\